jgi:ABC-type nitrate/sulfonate/bicarbonate transport system ATPase subunit
MIFYNNLRLLESGAGMKIRLSLEKIYSTYYSGNQHLPVLEGISLSVKAGEFVSVLGPSGSGKSTILKHAAGLLKPNQGQVLLDGVDISGHPQLVSYMPQQDMLFPWKTLLENAALPLLAAGIKSKTALDRVEKMLPDFGLAGFGGYYPHQLSGGMRQRAALMRMILVESKLILLDEPFAALDALTRENLQDWLLKIWSRDRRSVLFVTHSIDEAIYLSDRIYVITERPGKIILEQKIDLHRPRERSLVTRPEFSLHKKILIEALGADRVIAGNGQQPGKIN